MLELFFRRQLVVESQVVADGPSSWCISTDSEYSTSVPEPLIGMVHTHTHTQ
jgi:hypothetical protein